MTWSPLLLFLLLQVPVVAWASLLDTLPKGVDTCKASDLCLQVPLGKSHLPPFNVSLNHEVMCPGCQDFLV